jgi:hypothetical protein
MCVDVSKTASIDTPFGSLANSENWLQSPTAEETETVVNGDMVDGAAIGHESGSYTGSTTCPAGSAADCGVRSITAFENDDTCTPGNKAANKCSCPIDVATRNGGKCGVLKFGNLAGQAGEYEVHNKPESLGYAGVFRVGAWVKCSGDWDGTRQIIHSRFWGVDDNVLDSFDGPWKQMNPECKSNEGEEEIWEWVSKDWDSNGVVVAKYSVYVGYPLKNTRVKFLLLVFPSHPFVGTRAVTPWKSCLRLVTLIRDHPVAPSSTRILTLTATPQTELV